MPLARCRCLLLALLAWMAAGQLAAQAPAPAAFRFEHLTVDEGLSHSDADVVTQDSAGFIWVGTNRGLNRYDGLSLRQYMVPPTPKGIVSNRIRALLPGPGGRVWVGTERAGLSYYDPATERIQTFDPATGPAATRPLLEWLATTTVTALVADGVGRLWVGTKQDGVFELVFGAGQRLRTAQHLLPAQPGRAAGSYDISSLVVDAEHTLWVGARHHGLLVGRPGSPTLEPTAVTDPVQALYLDPRGDLWVGLSQRVLWVSAARRRNGQELAATPLPLTFPNVQALRLDSFHRLWVGTLYGLYVWEAGPTTGLGPPLGAAPTLLLPTDGLPFSFNSERVQSLFEDRTQVMWLCASAGGLNWVDLRQKPFSQLRQRQAGQAVLANNYVNAIYPEAATQTLWIGTRNGVAAYDQVRHTYRNYLSKSDLSARGVDVASIKRTHDGALWFGTRGHGLLCLRRQGGREQLTTLDELPDGLRLRDTSVEQLVEDQAGTLWAATSSAGLLHLSLDGQILGLYGQPHNALPSSAFSFLLADPRQPVLWASTTGQGLLKLDISTGTPRLLRHYQQVEGQADGLQSNYVWPLLLDRQGTLWIGTIGGGLHQLDTNAGSHDTVRSLRKYLPESDVESILADDAGQLWLGGTGLYRYQPATHQYLRYDMADGLASTSFKVGAAARGTDGTLYFGGINGVTYFLPALIRPNPYPPVVQLTGLRVANQPVAVGQPLNGRVLLSQPLNAPQTVIIQPSENDFAVDFVGLNYANPHKTRYAYQLEGYNRGWVYPAPGQRTASFANLPPGHYALRVKASNGEGAWSAPAATLQFEVRAPWYRMPWAYALYALLALGAVLLYRRVEMRQQELRNRLTLKNFQTEKEKELTNLRLGFFTDLSHELRTPLTLILGPMEEIIRRPTVPDLPDKLQLMQRQAQKLLDLVNQLLDFRKVENGHVPLRAALTDAIPFLTEQYASFRHKAQERGARYVLDLPAEPVWLYFDRSKLEIIMTNLLANAFKYVRNQGRVELTATVVGQPTGEAVYENEQLVGNYLKITVSDTGMGIAPADIERIFEPYYQAVHTPSLRQAGTGIGLTLARQFAERHGGRLLVASTQGVGTSFELRLPLGQAHLGPGDLAPAEVSAAGLAPAESPAEASEPAEVAPAASDAGSAPSSTSPPRLLVVEDHAEVREYLCQLFAASYQVQAAEDGEAGWEMALSHPPDLIISDVMMPRLDGLGLCQRLKQHAKTSHIPVLLLTARTAETHQLEGLGLGADAYMSKPFNPALLQAQVAALLQSRRRLHEFYQRNILLQPSTVVVADAEREFLQRAMTIVEQRIGDPSFGVPELSAEMAMSQSAFYRRLKTITGQTTVEFIRDVRLKRAAQLLTSSALHVSEVAYEVGIENVKYFRQIFQKLYGMPPTEYARQQRGAAAAPASSTFSEE